MRLEDKVYYELLSKVTEFFGELSNGKISSIDTVRYKRTGLPIFVGCDRETIENSDDKPDTDYELEKYILHEYGVSQERLDYLLDSYLGNHKPGLRIMVEPTEYDIYGEPIDYPYIPMRFELSINEL